jgi:hypothetical protein
MKPGHFRHTRLASACIAALGLGVLSAANAGPIAYNIQIGGGTWGCGALRPVGQACPAGLTGTLTVDSSLGNFAAQFIDFTLQVGDYLTFTRNELSSIGLAQSTFSFDGSGALTGFDFRNFFGPTGTQGPLGDPLNLYYMNLSSGAAGNEYRFGGRTDHAMLNQCTSCVSFARAVPEPGSLALWAIGLGGLWLTRRRWITKPS